MLLVDHWRTMNPSNEFSQQYRVHSTQTSWPLVHHNKKLKKKRRMNDIFNLGNDNKKQWWPPFCCDGITYDLSHLNAHEVTFGLKEGRFRFIVTYSHHCFAKNSSEDISINSKWTYLFGNESRTFNLERYELSKRLPSLLVNLMSTKTYHAGYNTYAFCEVIKEESVVYYKIAFVMYRHARKYRLHVASAYPVDENDYSAKRRVNFASIVISLSKGKKLPTPK